MNRIANVERQRLQQVARRLLEAGHSELAAARLLVRQQGISVGRAKIAVARALNELTMTGGDQLPAGYPADQQAAGADTPAARVES